MESTELKQKSSKPVSLILLIPALLCGIISIAMAVVGLGLIPILPAVISIVLCVASFFFFKRSYKKFTYIIVCLSIIASLVAVFRGVIIEEKVAADIKFDSTVVKTQEGIDSDLEDAFSDIEEVSDSTAAPL
jgi:uncharacterized membrane protein YbaN (DUF454 family)